MQHAARAGEPLTWHQQIRFRHVVTRKYLMVDLNSRTDLIDDGHDPRTVFKLHPVLQDRDEITLGGYGRIEHMVTGSWLHSLKGALERLHVRVHYCTAPLFFYFTLTMNAYY